MTLWYHLIANFRSSPDLIKTLDTLESYGNEGLRTLLVAQKKITQKEYDDWMIKYTVSYSIFQI